MSTLFADTYALIEMIKGNPAYDTYVSINLITAQYNLIELYYTVLRELGEEEANFYFHYFSKIAVKEVSTEVIKVGMKFKLQYKKEDLSYVDCLGYALAQEQGIKFLTGDSKFATKENVEFVR